ncbi:ACSM3 isoform 7, partial [Pongo abelii]
KWRNKTGLDIYEGYGQTETVLICGNFKGMKIKPGSMGKPSPAFDVKIVDVNGNVLPPGQEGDIGIQVLPNRPFGLFTHYVVVKAFVVLNPDYKSHDQEQLIKEIQEHVKKTTAPYKYPRKVEFIQELPKTISGKT